MITLVIIHVFLLSTSVLLTTGSAITAAAGFNVPKLLLAFNAVATIIGVSSGVALLFSSSLDARCATLFAYVVAFGFAHAYIVRKNQSLAESFDS
jgi:hypothetical protein